MIAIVDYDIGNLAAVANMLHRVGALTEITSDPKRIALADKIILPGNGAFDACMVNLRKTGLIPLLEDKILGQKTPVLGICVGAQLLGTSSEEGTEPGLGWLDMAVRRFPRQAGLRVPHMGWNEVIIAKPEHALVREFESMARFYFVHSYYLDPERDEDILLRTNYSFEFASAVGRENIQGVQFHPEKSHRFGKKLLANFATMEL